MRTSAVALCRRVNHYIEASVDPVTISNGEITWNILINNFGYSAQPDGTCIVTDYLGSGMEFISAEKYDRDGELEILEVTPQDNGQTKVVFKITGLKHDEVSKENRLNQNYTYDFNIRLKAKITNEDYLYGANSQYYNFGNKATYIDRFGNKMLPELPSFGVHRLRKPWFMTNLLHPMQSSVSLPTKIILILILKAIW